MILDGTNRYRIEYEDVLRAVGYYLDVNDYRDISLIELPDGMIVKGAAVVVAHRATRLYSRSYYFKNDELEQLLEDAYTRRGRRTVTSAGSPHTPLSNQDLLRVVGRVIDEEKWYDIVVTQVPEGVRIKALVRPMTTATEGDQVVDVFLAQAEIKRWIDELRAGRRPVRSRQAS